MNNFNEEEKKMIEENRRVTKKILKSAAYTIIIFLVFMYGLNTIFQVASIGGSGDGGITIPMYISVIFTMFYCTFTIIDEIKKTK